MAHVCHPQHRTMAAAGKAAAARTPTRSRLAPRYPIPRSNVRFTDSRAVRTCSKVAYQWSMRRDLCPRRRVTPRRPWSYGERFRRHRMWIHLGDAPTAFRATWWGSQVRFRRLNPANCSNYPRWRHTYSLPIPFLWLNDFFPGNADHAI
jgi:hypothetical protein